MLGITSGKGFPSGSLLSPPVPHFFRVSESLPLNGFLAMTQGSQQDRGIEETSLKSFSASLGLKPPFKVRTSLTTTPRSSSPASLMAEDTVVRSKGFDAMKTCPPGTSTGRTSSLHVSKKLLSSLSSFSERTVNLGRGRRLLPPIFGGIRHIPPLLSFSLRSSFSLYSTIP